MQMRKGCPIESGGPHSALYEHVSPVLKTDFVTQEFGTYSNLYVLQALRDENRVHHGGDRSPTHKTKRRLKDTFTPDDPAWQAKVISDGVSLFEGAAKVVFDHSNK